MLGGIGPESTGVFYSRLISRLQKRGLIESNGDYPQIIINSIPAKELLSDRHDEKDLDVYIRGIRELEQIGVDFIVMVCNTLHYYYEFLQGQTSVPILDLRAEVRRVLEKRGIASMTMIGTPVTIRGGLYEIEGVIHNRLSDEEINLLSAAICDFNRGVEREEQIRKVNSVVSRYIAKSDAILVSCTKLSAMIGVSDKSIDTLNVLVDSTIERALEQASKNRQIRQEEATK